MKKESYEIPCLEKYEEVCPKCNGCGVIYKRWSAYDCLKCNGRGKIDWIDEIKRV